MSKNRPKSWIFFQKHVKYTKGLTVLILEKNSRVIHFTTFDWPSWIWSSESMKSFDFKSPWVQGHQLERSSLQDLAKCELPNIFSALWKKRETYYLLSSLMNWVHFSRVSSAHFLLSHGPIRFVVDFFIWIQVSSNRWHWILGYL